MWFAAVRLDACYSTSQTDDLICRVRSNLPAPPQGAEGAKRWQRHSVVTIFCSGRFHYRLGPAPAFSITDRAKDS